MDIITAIHDERLFHACFRDLSTWSSWFVLLKALFGLPMDAEEFKLNPAALKRTLGTGGRNLVAGVTQLVDDWRHNGRLPSSVDVSKFKVGGNLAMTPGDVVFRSEQLELIQYRPQTEQVHGTPLFIVPPQINKYYVWDLAPGRSLIEFLVQQGFTVFVVSWFNPTAAQADWGLATYVLALEDAMRAARGITRSQQLHVLGACSGGITASALLAHLALKLV